MTSSEETRFQAWAKENKIPGETASGKEDPTFSAADNTYDMRGYWKKYAAEGKTAGGINPADKKWHFTDEFKTPYHETFSAESKYALPSAPHWQGSDKEGWKLVDKNGKVIKDETPKGNT